MKKMLLLLIVLIITQCKAQQKELDSLLKELKIHPQEDTVRLNLLYNISAVYQSTNPGEGIIKSNEGIQISRKLENELWLGKFISSKGNNYMNEGKYDSALLMLKTALQLFEKHNYEHGVFSALNSIAIIQLYTADYARALSTYSKNLRIAESVKDTGQILAAINNVSLVYRAISNYPEALTYDLKAIYLAEKSSNKMNLTNVYGEAGLTYRALKQTDKAEAYYQKALNNCIQTGNKRDEATLLSALGQISADKEDYQQALYYYQQAISVGNVAGNVQTVEETLGNAGDVYKNTSDYPNAIAFYKKALATAQKIGDKNNTAYLLAELGDVFAKTSQHLSSQSSITLKEQQQQALSYLNQSLTLAKEMGALDRQAIALDYLSNFYEKQKDYQKALDLSKQARVIEDSMFNDKTKDNITRLEMQYQFSKTQDSIKAVTDKQQALANAQIQKQRIIRNATMAGAGFLFLAGLGGFAFYKRNRDIRFKQQITDTEMKALRAQMNPHFIFNVLNSISNYMIKNDMQKADEYLIKFANLMRSVLKNSEQKEVSLSDDLQALESYMQLEALRMENKFTYEIKVADDIDKDNTLIQPLLLQPFVENSIKHGLEKKNGDGKIIICIQQENNMLICSVEDNGIGRKMAESYKKQTSENERKSFGLKITGARIEIINKLKKTNAAITMFDLTEGTKAEVRLPLELSF